MKKTNPFSYIGYAFHSILSHKRRNLSISAGIILGAAIFSSIFFYGALVNAIAVEDIVNLLIQLFSMEQMLLEIYAI